MKILLSAYACEPHRGSEPGVGWHMATAIADQHQVCVLTTRAHQPAIAAEMARQPNPNLEFVYVDPLGWVYDWSQEGKRPQLTIHLHYYLWQIWAYWVGRSRHRTQGFDLAHHVTYVKYQSPSFLCLLPIPFIWGPVGGAESAPLSFWQDFSLKNKLFETIRTIARQVGEFDPFVRLTVHRSAVIWATTQDTARRLRHLGAQQVGVMGESGLTQTEIAQLAEYPPPAPTPLRFISMGRLLHWKGFHLSLHAFALAKLVDAEYWILGTGPEKARLQALANALQIDHQVKFWDRLPREETLQKLAESHIMVHPSLHDSGGWVCLEAMAVGRPVICLDLGGPGVQVTAATGFKIPAHSPSQAVEKMAQAMIQLAIDPDLRDRLGQAGQQHIRDTYSWESRAQVLTKIYTTVATDSSMLSSERL
jgi:glycosyltransferase involved in cell wall biosynthesis